MSDNENITLELDEVVVVAVEEPEHQAIVVEEIDAIVVDEPEAIAVEESQAIVVEESQAIVVEEIDAIAVDEPEAIAVDEPEAIAVDEPEAIAVEESQAIVVEESQAIVVEEIDAIAVDEPEAIAVEESQDIVVEESQDIAVEEIKKPEAIAIIVEEIKEPEAIAIAVEEIKEPEPEAIAVEEIKEPEAIAIIVEEIKKPEPEAIVIAVEEIKKPEPEAIVIAVEEIKEPIAVAVALEKPEFKNNIPKIVFIVPYRDRVEQQRFFSFQMEKIMEDYKKSDYKIIYAHQQDKRTFNRGAMKNIGFLYAKSLYPNDYKNITFVFNDVDTMPYNKNFLTYETTQGNVKHFYGYHFTLGGIVSITGADFEKINGFPNFWAWGYEDNLLNNRVFNAKLVIDRSQFYPIFDKNILQLKDGLERIVNRGEFDKYLDEVRFQQNMDGIYTLSNISYTFDDNTSFLNISSFQTPIPEKPELNKVHDIRNGNIPFLRPQQRRRGSMGMMF